MLEFVELLYIIHTFASIALDTRMCKGITLLGPWLNKPITMIK